MTYRVVSTGEVVARSATRACTGCEGHGVTVANNRARCGSCGGSGRLLGTDPYTWPIPVEPIGGDGSYARQCGR